MQSPLNGAELRFLRLEMDTTQKDLAGMLGTTEQTLRLWEKNRTKSINGTADRLLRALYADYVGGKGSVRRMLKRLADLRESEHTAAYFRAMMRRDGLNQATRLQSPPEQSLKRRKARQSLTGLLIAPQFSCVARLMPI
jgi:transcriptional regulator with XRE-family HTH domain